MNPAEIKKAYDSGKMSAADAQAALVAHRQKNSSLKASKNLQPQPSQVVAHPKNWDPITKKIIDRSRLASQINDKAALAEVRQDLALFLQSRDAEHFAHRVYIEETARHLVGIPAYALLGLVDGVLDAAGSGISEIVEDITFTVARTARRAKEGWQRGLNG